MLARLSKVQNTTESYQTIHKFEKSRTPTPNWLVQIKWNKCIIQFCHWVSSRIYQMIYNASKKAPRNWCHFHHGFISRFEWLRYDSQSNCSSDGLIVTTRTKEASGVGSGGLYVLCSRIRSMTPIFPSALASRNVRYYSQWQGTWWIPECAHDRRWVIWWYTNQSPSNDKPSF